MLTKSNRFNLQTSQFKILFHKELYPTWSAVSPPSRSPSTLTHSRSCNHRQGSARGFSFCENCVLISRNFAFGQLVHAVKPWIMLCERENLLKIKQMFVKILFSFSKLQNNLRFWSLENKIVKSSTENLTIDF